MPRKGDASRVHDDLASQALNVAGPRVQDAWTEYVCRCINSGRMVQGSMHDLRAWIEAAGKEG